MLFLAKGDPYAKVVVDSQPPKKTEPARKTWEPIWNESFVVLVLNVKLQYLHDIT